MGSIDIIEPLSTVLSIAVNKSQRHQEKNSREDRESNPRLLGENQVCCLRAKQPPPLIGVVVVAQAPLCAKAAVSFQTNQSRNTNLSTAPNPKMSQGVHIGQLFSPLNPKFPLNR